MLNTMVIIKMGNCTFDDWKKAFDADSEVIIKMGNCTFDDWKKAFDADSETDAQFMKDIIVGKVDEHTAIVSADVFAPEKMEVMMSDPEFQKIEAEMGLEHTVYQINPASA